MDEGMLADLRERVEVAASGRCGSLADLEAADRLRLAPDGFTATMALPGRAIAYAKDGVDWTSAPLPRRWHSCSAQTTCYYDHEQLARVERCACGAIRYDDGLGWDWRNSRRQS